MEFKQSVDLITNKLLLATALPKRLLGEKDDINLVTQLEIFKALLNVANIKYDIRENITYFSTENMVNVSRTYRYVITVHNKDYGYSGTFSEWMFNDAGELLNVAHWE